MLISIAGYAQITPQPITTQMVAKLWMARVLLKKGNKAAAMATANNGVKAAEAVKRDEYIRLNNEVWSMQPGKTPYQGDNIFLHINFRLPVSILFIVFSN